jgi:hypothetical protein
MRPLAFYRPYFDPDFFDAVVSRHGERARPAIHHAWEAAAEHNAAPTERDTLARVYPRAAVLANRLDLTLLPGMEALDSIPEAGRRAWLAEAHAALSYDPTFQRLLELAVMSSFSAADFMTRFGEDQPEEIHDTQIVDVGTDGRVYAFLVEVHPDVAGTYTLKVCRSLAVDEPSRRTTSHRR